MHRSFLDLLFKKPKIEADWKQEWSPTRNGWFDAVSKTCFSVCTQSMSSSSHTSSFFITFIAYNRCVCFRRTSKTLTNYIFSPRFWIRCSYFCITSSANDLDKVKIIESETFVNMLIAFYLYTSIVNWLMRYVTIFVNFIIITWIVKSVLVLFVRITNWFQPKVLKKRVLQNYSLNPKSDSLDEYEVVEVVTVGLECRAFSYRAIYV